MVRGGPLTEHAVLYTVWLLGDKLFTDRTPLPSVYTQTPLSLATQKRAAAGRFYTGARPVYKLTMAKR